MYSYVPSADDLSEDSRGEFTTSDMWSAAWLLMHDIPIREVLVISERPRRVRFTFDNADGEARRLIDQYFREPESAMAPVPEVKETMKVLWRVIDRAAEAY